MRYARDFRTGEIIDADLLSTASFVDSSTSPQPRCLECEEELGFRRASEVSAHFRMGIKVSASSHPPCFTHHALSRCPLQRAGAHFPFRAVAVPSLKALAEKAHIDMGEEELKEGRKILKMGKRVGLEIPNSEPGLRRMAAIAHDYLEQKEGIYPLWIWPIIALGEGLENIEDIKREEYRTRTFRGLWESVRIAGLSLQEGAGIANKVMVVDVKGRLATVALNKYDSRNRNYRLYVVSRDWMPALRLDPFKDEAGKVLGTMLRPIEADRTEDRRGQMLSIYHGEWRVDDGRFPFHGKGWVKPE